MGSLLEVIEEEFDYWNTVKLYKDRRNRRRCRRECRFYNRRHISRHNQHCCFHNLCFQRGGRRCLLSVRRNIKPLHRKRALKFFPYNRETIRKPTCVPTADYQCLGDPPQTQGRHITVISEELFRKLLQMDEGDEETPVTLAIATKAKPSVKTSIPHGMTTTIMMNGNMKKKNHTKTQALSHEHWPSLLSSRNSKSNNAQVPSLSRLSESFQLEKIMRRTVRVKAKPVNIVAKMVIPHPEQSKPSPFGDGKEVVDSVATRGTKLANRSPKRSRTKHKVHVISEMAVKTEGVHTTTEKMAACADRRKESSKIKKPPAVAIGKKLKHKHEELGGCVKEVGIDCDSKHQFGLEEDTAGTGYCNEIDLHKHRTSVLLCEVHNECKDLCKVAMDSEDGRASAKKTKKSLIKKTSLVPKPAGDGIKPKHKNGSTENTLNPEPTKKNVKELILEVMRSYGISPLHVPGERKFDEGAVNPYSLRYFVVKEKAWLSCLNCNSSLDSSMYCYIDLKTQKICHRFQKECKECRGWMIPRFSSEAIERMAVNSIRKFFVFAKRN